MRQTFVVLSLCVSAAFVRTESLTERENNEVHRNCGFERNPYGGHAVKRMMGGYDSPPLPYAVRLHYGNAQCEGTLISTRHVLTAAHCVYNQTLCDAQNFSIPMEEIPRTNRMREMNKYAFTDARKWIAVFASPCGQTICEGRRYGFAIGVHKVIANSRYGHNHCVGGDIAIIELVRDVKTYENPKPACLPLPHSPTQRIVFAFGRGQNPRAERAYDLHKLNQFQILHLAVTQCGNYNVNDIICTQEVYSSVCAGDSGGGLMQKEKGRTFVLGITSFGEDCWTKLHNIESGRAFLNRPGADTDVRLYVGWICRMIGRCVDHSLTTREIEKFTFAEPHVFYPV